MPLIAVPRPVGVLVSVPLACTGTMAPVLAIHVGLLHDETEYTLTLASRRGHLLTAHGSTVQHNW